MPSAEDLIFGGIADRFQKESQARLDRIARLRIIELLSRKSAYGDALNKIEATGYGTVDRLLMKQATKFGSEHMNIDLSPSTRELTGLNKNRIDYSTQYRRVFPNARNQSVYDAGMGIGLGDKLSKQMADEVQRRLKEETAKGLTRLGEYLNGPRSPSGPKGPVLPIKSLPREDLGFKPRFRLWDKNHELPLDVYGEYKWKF